MSGMLFVNLCLLCNILELLFSLWCRVFIRMELLSELGEGLLDLWFRSTLVNTKDF